MKFSERGKKVPGNEEVSEHEDVRKKKKKIFDEDDQSDNEVDGN